MKIAHVIGYFQPELGYEEYYTALTQKKLGHDVYVITSDRIFPFKNVEKMLKEVGSEYPGRKREVGFSEVNGLKIYRLPAVIELFYDFILVIGVRKVLSQIKPDIVHIHGCRQGPQVLAALQKDLGFKIVMDEHDVGATYSDEPTLKNRISKFEFMVFRRRYCKMGYKRADKIVPVTEQTQNYLKSMFNIADERMILLQLGANTDIFRYNKAKRNEIREMLGVKQNELLIITVGRLMRLKKIEYLIEAAAKLLKKHKLKILIIGRGEEDYLAELKKLTMDLTVAENVFFKGFVKPTDLPDYYSAADIGFWGRESITIQEAMACRLPIVIADMLSMSHLASHDNGFTFEPDDAESLKVCLEKLITDDKLRRQMGKNSQKAVDEKYSYDIRTKKLISIYEKLLGE